MSITEEETELRDLLIENLHNNGVLAKLKAQLRSSVFKSLEEISHDGKDPEPQSSYLKDLIANPQGVSIIKIICEFLQFLNLEYTLNTLQAEVSIAQDFKVDRKELAKEFNINEKNDNKKYPFIWSLLAQRQDTGKENNPIAQTSMRKEFIPNELNNDKNNNATQDIIHTDIKDRDNDASKSYSSSSSSSFSSSSTLSTSTNQKSKKDKKKKQENQKSSSSSSSWPDSKSKTKKEEEDDNKTPTNTNINAKNNKNKTDSPADKNDARGVFAAHKLDYKLGDEEDDEIEEDIIIEDADSKSSSKSELMRLSDETVTSSKDVGADYMEDVKNT